MSFPYMPLFVGDYLRDTRGLTTEEHGAYLLLLMELWSHDGSLPMDHDYLARVVGVTRRRWEGKIWPVICLYFEVKRDRLGTTVEHRRLSTELEKTRENFARRSNAGKRGAAKKWNNYREGHMAMPEQCSGKPEPEPERITTTVDVERGAVIPFGKKGD